MRAKRIPLKVLEETKPGSGDLLDYRGLLTMVLSNSKTGTTVGEIRKRLQLLDDLEASTEYFELTFQDHGSLLKDIESAPLWTKVSKNILTFVDDIRDAQDVVG